MTISNTTRTKISERAEARCEYCRLPDAVSTHSFHIDHILPIKHEGTDEIDNLAWACLSCNLHKGSDISAFDDVGQLIRLFNPREDKWDEHFILDGYEITGISAIGRVTVKILKMNSAKQMDARKPLIDAKLW